MKLTPRERRCLIAGYRIAKAQAKREREQLADMFFATLDEVKTELGDMRNEVSRMRAIERAAAVERDPWTLLN